MKIPKLPEFIHLSILFLLSVALVHLSGCSAEKTLIRESKNLETLANHSPVKSSLIKRAESLKSLKGIAKIKLKTEKKEISFNAIVVLKNPDLLRLEILGPFNQLIAIISSDGKNIYQADLKNSRMIVTPVSKSSSEKFLGIPLLPEEIFKIITGTIQINENTRTEVKLDRENNIYVLNELSSSDSLMKKYLISTLTMNTLKLDVSDKDGNLVYETGYSDYQEADNCSVPKKITCNYYFKNIMIDIDFKDISLNTEIPFSLFSLENQKGLDVIYQE